VRAAKQQTKSDADAFEEFFHPQQAAPSPTPVAAILATPSSSSSSVPENKIDINTASKEQLDALPGVGSVIADRIIADRPFKSADDLRKVKGIGDKRYDKLRPYFN
jgi:competence protein ComEA